MGKSKKTQASVESTSTASRGRGKLTATLNDAQLKGQIDKLLSDLRSTTDQRAKKKIRRALRTRGHFGGLGIVTRNDDNVAGDGAGI